MAPICKECGGEMVEIEIIPSSAYPTRDELLHSKRMIIHKMLYQCPKDKTVTVE